MYSFMMQYENAISVLFLYLFYLNTTAFPFVCYSNFRSIIFFYILFLLHVSGIWHVCSYIENYAEWKQKMNTKNNKVRLNTEIKRRVKNIGTNEMYVSVCVYFDILMWQFECIHLLNQCLHFRQKPYIKLKDTK